jgi:competence protein ComEC
MADDQLPAHPSTPPRHRPLVPVLAGFALGIAVDSSLQPPAWSWVVPALAAAGLTWWGLRRGLHEWGHWLLAVVLMAALGGFWDGVHFRSRPPWHLARLPLDESALYFVRAEVKEEPIRLYRHGGFAPIDAASEGQYWSVRMAAEALSGNGRQWRRVTGGLTAFSGGDRPELSAGDRVEFCGRFQHNRPATNPGERNRALGYEREGSYATASVQDPSAFKILREGHWYSSPGAAASRLRVFLGDRIEDLLGDKAGETYGLVNALLLGRRDALTPELESLLKESGTLHFLAISGLHVGLFCLFCQSVLALVGLSVRPRAVVCIVLIWAYVLLTGCHVSALRAGLMLTLMLGAPVVGRQWDSLSALCGAAFLILLMSPQQLFNAGFQLTFVAVWALICIYPRLCRLLWPWQDLVEGRLQEEERTVWGDLWDVSKAYLLLSCVVWAATAPLRLYHFHALSPWGPLVNLAMWPMVLVLLLLSFALALCVLLGSLGAGLAAVVAWFFGIVAQGLLQMAAHLPGAALYLPAPPAWWVGLCYVAMAVWVVRGQRPHRRALFLAATAVLAVGYLGNELAVRLDRRFRLTVADVGMGQAALMEVPTGQALMFDAGSRRLSASTAVAEMLWHRHVGGLNAVVLSHLDGDHCSFVPFLSERFAVGQVMVPQDALVSASADRVRESLRQLGLVLRPLREGARLTAGDLRCIVLHPDLTFATTAGLSDNDRSLVIRCEYEGARILLTGDIEERAMLRLVRDYGPELQADVLMIPHHARHNIGVEDFIGAVQPQAAIVSGRLTDCDPTTAAMLRTSGASLWITGEEGAIIVSVERGQIHVQGYASGRAETFAPRRSY